MAAIDGDHNAKMAAIKAPAKLPPIALAPPVVVGVLAAAVVVVESFLQTTESGVWTPSEPQIFLAYLTAASLPAASQALSRQQAMPLRKSSFLQTQAMSSCLQPAILLPTV